MYVYIYEQEGVNCQSRDLYISRAPEFLMYDGHFDESISRNWIEYVFISITFATESEYI